MAKLVGCHSHDCVTSYKVFFSRRPSLFLSLKKQAAKFEPRKDHIPQYCVDL